MPLQSTLRLLLGELSRQQMDPKPRSSG